MKARYAAAIREGIQKAQLTQYGDPHDRFYELRSQLIWAEVFPHDSRRCREVALEAFRRTVKRKRERETQLMTPEQRREAKRNFERTHLQHTESSSERESRLLREEVAAMREELSEIREREAEALATTADGRAAEGLPSEAEAAPAAQPNLTSAARKAAVWESARRATFLPDSDWHRPLFQKGVESGAHLIASRIPGETEIAAAMHGPAWDHLSDWDRDTALEQSRAVLALISEKLSG